MFQRLFREGRRTRAVRGLGLADGPAEPSFDHFVEQAAAAFDAPIALLSLIHGETMRFRAAKGMATPELPRRLGFCTHALDRGVVLESCDPADDLRFRALPIVTGAPHIRYYLGAPLTLVDGTDVGALCVLDLRRRDPASDDQRAYLRGLARQAAMALECRGDAGLGIAR